MIARHALIVRERTEKLKMPDVGKTANQISARLLKIISIALCFRAALR